MKLKATGKKSLVLQYIKKEKGKSALFGDLRSGITNGAKTAELKKSNKLLAL